MAADILCAVLYSFSCMAESGCKSALKVEFFIKQIMTKPVIFLFAPYYIPGFKGGGPIQTVANLAVGLGSHFKFFIFTSDRDLGDVKPYEGVLRNQWVDVLGASVYYASPSNLSMYSIYKVLKSIDFDVLYLNSLFSPRFTIFPLVMMRFGLVQSRKILIAPRGELSEGALALKSNKKQSFLRLAKILGLYKGCSWHASTQFEREDIRRKIFADESRIFIAQNVLGGASSGDGQLDGLSQEFNDIKPALKICFLSRISPMKNLDFAITVLRRVSAEVQFDIYGPAEDATYWSECLELIKHLPANVRVRYCGSVEHDDVRGTIAQYDLFFVPSRGENFGHVFAEAFSAGVPVLVSNRTPWRDLKRRCVGWDIPLEREDLFVSVINEVATYDFAARTEVRGLCKAFYKDFFDNENGVNVNVDMFKKILNGLNNS